MFRGSPEPASSLDKATIERGFELLNRLLIRDAQKATVNLVGGAVMLLVHELRPKTRDIDGWLAPENHIERQIREVGHELGDERWLNEQALMYFPDKRPGRGDWIRYRSYSNLIIQTADERTMFAMKALALRGKKDMLDFQYLAEILNIRTLEDAAMVISEYFKAGSLTQQSLARVGEALDELPAHGG